MKANDENLERLADPSDLGQRSYEAALEGSLEKARREREAALNDPRLKPREDRMCLNENCGHKLPKGRDRFCNKDCADEFELLENHRKRK